MSVRNCSRNNRRRAKSHFLIGCLLLAISLVICAKIITSNQNKEDDKTPVFVAEYDTVPVPVPLETVPSGTKISDISVKTINYPRHQLPAGAMLSLASVQDAVTTVMLPANLPFFKQNLSFSSGKGNPVIEQIPQGMRAITIRVDVTSAVEGWASSGSIVDVLLVEKDRTTVIAEQVKILSAERVTKPLDNNFTAPSVPSTVTLLVTQQQALALTTAVPRGKISFALRSKQDAEDWHDKDFTPEKLHNHLALSKKNQTIKGFVAVQTKNGEKKYALTEDGWVKSDVRPNTLFPEVKE